MKRQLFEILIPTRFNNGKLIEVEYHKKWDEWICNRCGGLTILRETRNGIWSNDGKNQREEMLPVRVACNEILDIEEILHFTMMFYHQKSIMAYQISDNVIIRNKSD